MTTFSLIKLICPICGSDFSSGSINSCGFATKRTDFRPNYWGMNPVEYFYHLCPHCGFCATDNSFEKPINLIHLVKKVKELGSLKEKNLPQKIERAVICLELMNKEGFINKDPFEIACFWLEPYYWSESEEDIKKYGFLGLSRLEQTFAEGSVPEEKEFCYKYLMGEIYRRIGELEKAHMLFDEVMLKTKNDAQYQNIHDLAFQQKTTPKDIL